MNPALDPLVDPPPAEVPLPEAPLVRVIAQVRFSPILAIQRPDFIAPFQEAIRSDYPILRPEQVLRPVAESIETTWRFSDMAGTWRASLAPDFAALETTRYSSREDFLQRLGSVLKALAEQCEPAQVRRIGLRYIDRVEGNATADIHKLVRQEMLGLMATGLSDHTQHAISETVLTLPSSSDRLRVRWGRIPPRSTIDPAAIEPIDGQSWILDLDMFSSAEQPFEMETILSSMRRYAERIYAMFRWAVTDEFLRRYGGKP